MKSKKNISLSFILSLAFHAIVALALWLRPDSTVQELTKKDEPVEVELVDAEKMLQAMKQPQPAAPKGQIVEQDEKRLNDEIPEDARFLSRHNQKVVRETQAALHGKFKNSDNTGGEKTPEQEAGKEADKQGEESAETKTVDNVKPDKTITSQEGFVNHKKPALKDLMPSFKPGPPRVETEALAKGGGDGSSATDDHLKNVQTGMQTLLSTREFVYYAYYNRIKDKLRQHWEPKIKEKFERIVRQGRTIASNTDRITKVVIILDNKGILQRVQIVGPSGLQDLDEAAVEAFRAAAPFPNPPKGIVEQDGTVKIRWDFILEANAGGLFDAMGIGFKTM